MNNKLFVGNLPFSIGDSDLRAAFAPHGNILSASVVIDRDTAQSRGFGFVEYGSAEEAQRAIEAMSGASLDGRSLTVNVSRPREGSRDSAGGRGPGRSSGGRPQRW